MSENRRTLAWVKGKLRAEQIASASGRLLLPVKIFIWSARFEIRPSPATARGTISACHVYVNRASGSVPVRQKTS